MPLIGDVTGGAYLHDGFLKGMQTIQRAGDATLSYDGTTVIFESMCGINNAAMGYALSIKFMDIGPTGSMAGTITYIHFYFKVRASLQSAYTPKLIIKSIKNQFNQLKVNQISQNYQKII